MLLAPAAILGSRWTRLVALLGLAGAIIVAARLPQGWIAERFLRVTDPARLPQLAGWNLAELAEWGLTGLVDEPIFWALLLLFVGSSALAAASRGSAPAESAGLKARVRSARTTRPEDAPEEVAAILRPVVGEPDEADWNGRRTRLSYRLGPRPSDLVRSHLGLALVLAGAAFILIPSAPERTVIRASLEATEARTGSRGTFDRVAGEELRAFQDADTYWISDFVADRAGLGPALFVQWARGRDRRPGGFWLFTEAPRGFDGRHRQANVGFDVQSARFEPVPGAGPTSRPWSWLMVLGLGLLVAGAVGRSRPEVRLEALCEGKTIELRFTGDDGRPSQRLWSRVERAVGETFPLSA